MLIPIRCFTCGTVLADKWYGYVKLVDEEKEKAGQTEDSILNLKNTEIVKTPEAIALDKLNLHRYCCRRMMISNINLIDTL
tara:strand:- start:23 stop:265 length:243 start_codon:yes stop_codon:yes gene_type:complete